MGHEDHSDHQLSISRSAHTPTPIRPAANSLTAHFCAVRRNVQAKFPIAPGFPRSKPPIAHRQRALDRRRSSAESSARRGSVTSPTIRAFVIVGHSRPSPPTLGEFNRQPHDHRRLVSDCDQTSGSALDDARHIGRSSCDQTTMRLAHKNPVVPDQRAKRAGGARMRH